MEVPERSPSGDVALNSQNLENHNEIGRDRNQLVQIIAAPENAPSRAASLGQVTSTSTVTNSENVRTFTSTITQTQSEIRQHAQTHTQTETGTQTENMTHGEVSDESPLNEDISEPSGSQQVMRMTESTSPQTVPTMELILSVANEFDEEDFLAVKILLKPILNYRAGADLCL